MSGPCAKQRVIAEIMTPDGARFYGENLCENPQEICPRGDMKTGEGYHLCREVCRQGAHAEVNAIAEAGSRSKGGRLTIHGHSYACASCRKAAWDAGIIEIRIGSARI